MLQERILDAQTVKTFVRQGLLEKPAKVAAFRIMIDKILVEKLTGESLHLHHAYTHIIKTPQPPAPLVQLYYYWLKHSAHVLMNVKLCFALTLQKKKQLQIKF